MKLFHETCLYCDKLLTVVRHDDKFEKANCIDCAFFYQLNHDIKTFQMGKSTNDNVDDNIEYNVQYYSRDYPHYDNGRISIIRINDKASYRKRPWRIPHIVETNCSKNKCVKLTLSKIKTYIVFS